MTSRRIAIAAWLAALAFCAWQAIHVRYVADLSMFLPPAPTPEQRVLVDQLREGAVSRLMLVAIEGGDARARAQVSRAMSAKLPFLANGAAQGFDREREFLLAHRYALSPRVAPERFTVEGLRAAVSDTIDLLASPAGALVKPLVPRDPTGEMVALLEQLRPGDGPRTVEGVWASADGARALLVGRTPARGSDTDAQAALMAEVESAFAAASAAAKAETPLRLQMTGPGVFSVRSRSLIKSDVERLATLSLGFIVTLLLVVYRSPRALALGLVPVASGALAGVAAVSLGFEAVHGITLGFGTALIGEAVDYSIYLFVQSEGAADAGWMARFWPTIRLGVLTSIAGFSAMLLSGLPGLAQLAVFSIAGLVAAALVTRFVLPVLLPRGFRIRDVSRLGSALRRGAEVLSRGRMAVPIVAIAALVFLAMPRERLWDRDIASLNPIPAADRALDAELREALGASDARHIVVLRGATLEAALQAAERAGARIDPLAAAGVIAGYESPARILPSAATQRARLESLPAEPVLRERLEEALAPLPLRPARLEPFIADVNEARASAPITRENLADTALAAALDGLLFRDGEGRWTALVGLRPPPGRTIDEPAVRKALAGTDATVIDVKGELDRLYAGYFDRAIAASLAGLAAIVLMLFGTLRSPARVLRVMVPLAAGVLVAAALHIAAGTPLTLLHLVGLLLIVAIGSNYALFFDRMAVDPSGATPRTFASLALANATTVASYGVMALSTVPVLQALGGTVAVGALATLVFAAMRSARRVDVSSLLR